MDVIRTSLGAQRPRWDRHRVVFEMGDGADRIECAISQAALQSFSEVRVFSPSEMLSCFAKARKHIEAIALRKYRARSDDMSGRVNIWETDMDDLPPHGTPAVTAIAIG